MESGFQKRNRYKAIVDLAPDIVYTLSKDGIILSLSPSFQEITGWKVEDWIGKHFSGIVHEEDLPLAFGTFRKTMRRKTVHSYDLRILTKKGDYLYGEFSSAPDIVNGKVVGQIGIARDITRHKFHESENLHYSNLVQSADSAIISRDLNGTITTWNKAAEKLFGYKAFEVLGKNFSIIVPSDKKKELDRIYERILNRESIEDYETVRLDKYGKRIHIIAKMSPIYDREGNIIGTSVFDRDNTLTKKRQEYEEILRKANKILPSSLNFTKTLKRLAKIMIPDIADWCAIYIIDNDELDRIVVAHENPKEIEWVEELQKRITEGNNNSKEIFEVYRSGKPRFYPHINETMLGGAVRDSYQLKIMQKLHMKSVIMVPLVSSSGVLGVMALVATDKSPEYEEDDLKFALEMGKLAGQSIENAKLYYQSQDEVKKRKKAEGELRRSRDQLKVIFENIADGMTVQDTNGALIYANEAAAIGSGYSSIKEMLKNPRKWVDLYEMRDESGNLFDLSRLPGRRALSGEENPEEVIYFKNKKTQEERWSIVKARPILNENGQVEAVVNIVSDITQRKELERKKDDFISIASHELKTPVTSIKGFLHLLKKQMREEGEKRMYVEKVETQIEKLTQLIEELLDLSRSRSKYLVYDEEVFDMKDLISETIMDLQNTTDKHKILFKNGQSARIKADRDRIYQVIMNLISNAIKYSPEGDKVLVVMDKESGNVRVAVTDYGIGIEENEVDKVFERFYRVKDMRDKTYPGLGIGLFLSKEIVLRHNGKIWAESKKGKGSTFYFSLPLQS